MSSAPSTEADFDGVFAKVIELRLGGLVIGGDPFFTARQEQLAALAVRHAVPTVYENREFIAAGGLIGYSGSITDAYRLAGVYAARFLKGEKPGELPVQQSTMRSRTPSRHSRTTNRTRFWLPLTHSSSVGASSLPRWRRAMCCPRSILGATRR